MKARKKPIEIEYLSLPENLNELKKWETEERPIEITCDENAEYCIVKITTLEGIMEATEKDVIIKGVNGEIYPCKKEIFEKTYERIN